MQNPIFFIPHNRKYIVYLPLLPMAFVCNAEMISYIKNLQFDNIQQYEDDETFRLLYKIGFFRERKNIFKESPVSKDFKPTKCVLLLTTACNLNCVYCYADFKTDNQPDSIMPLHVGKEAIDIVCSHARDLGRDFFSLGFHGGGEPMMARDQMMALISYAKSKDIPSLVSLTTNGYSKAEDMEALIRLGVNDISLSCDGAPAIQNRQRPSKSGKSSWNPLLENIKLLEKHAVPYGIRLSVMDDSIHELVDSIAFLCAETSCKTFQVEPVFRQGKAARNGNYLRRFSEFADQVVECTEVARSYGRHLYYSGSQPLRITSQFCTATHDTLVVNHNGELTACFEVFDRQHSLGDRFFIGKLGNGEIELDKAKRNRLLDLIETRKSICKEADCFCYYHCAGDCAAKSAGTQIQGKIPGNNRCTLNRNLTRKLLFHYIEQSEGIWYGNEQSNKQKKVVRV